MVQIIIYLERCDGCGMCIEVCHKGQRIFKIEKIGNEHKCVVQDASYCNVCTTCASKCPKKAINLVRNDKKDNKKWKKQILNVLEGNLFCS